MTHLSKWIDTSRVVPHVGHSNESILGRNDYPMCCLRMALSCWYLLYATHTETCTGNASWAGWQLRNRVRESQKHFSPFTSVASLLTTRLWLICQMTGTTRSVVSHISRHGQSIVWVRMINHSVAHIWHWRINIWPRIKYTNIVRIVDSYTEQH